jgi:hypothetical protein
MVPADRARRDRARLCRRIGPDVRALAALRAPAPRIIQDILGLVRVPLLVGSRGTPVTPSVTRHPE